MAEYRVEKDFLGEVKVPKDALWGVQTQRAIDNFPISGIRFGRRFLYLVQSNNPELHFGPVGGLEPRWNPQEWLDKDRGLQ